MHLLHIIRQFFLRVRKIKTVKEFLYEFFETNKEILCQLYPGLRADIFLQKYLQWHNFDRHLQEKDSFLNPNDSFFVKCLQGIPFEYLLGEKFFFNHSFIVNTDVLIPRNETEILVENAINYIKKNYHADFQMAEIGTGSGCIFLSILCEIDEQLSCKVSDICSSALAVAKNNLYRLQPLINKNSKIDFYCGDRLEKIEGEFDLIISNPPYIKEIHDKAGVHPQVLTHEPHLALFLPDDQYNQWFLTFFKQCEKALKKGGTFMMEGHEDSLEELANMASSMFSSIQLIKDYTGRFRFLHLTK